MFLLLTEDTATQKTPISTNNTFLVEKSNNVSTELMVLLADPKGWFGLIGGVRKTHGPANPADLRG